MKVEYLASSNAGILEQWSVRKRRLGGRDTGNLTDDNIRAATSTPETIWGTIRIEKVITF